MLSACSATADPPTPAPATPVAPTTSAAPAPEPTGSPTAGSTDEPTDGLSALAGAAESLATLAPSPDALRAECEGPSVSRLPSRLASLAPQDERSSHLNQRCSVLGADISWPQCPRGLGIPERPTLGMPMPIPEAEYVVIGLTNGPGSTSNPCLADQVAWARDAELMVSAYAVASWPGESRIAEQGATGPFDAATRTGRISNAGHQQGLFNLASLRAADLRTPIIWIDVEAVPDFDWPADLAENAAVVRGLARAYRDAGFEIGVYSTPYLWKGVVGDLSLGVPEWRAAGQTSRQEALDRCGDDWVIQGGPAVLGQWVAQRRDHNVTCPGVEADLGRWFHQY